MSLNRWAKRRDACEPEIVNALRRLGASVVRLDTPVDLLVGYRGATVLLEIKLPQGPKGGTADRTATPSQQAFFDSWKGGPALIVRSLEEALAAIGVVRPAA